MSDLKILKTESGQQVVDYEYAKNLIEQQQARIAELERELEIHKRHTNLVGELTEYMVKRGIGTLGSTCTTEIVRLYEELEKRNNELAATVERLLKACELARDSYGKMLMTDPPQEAWKANQVTAKLVEAIAATPRQNLDAVKREVAQEAILAAIKDYKREYCGQGIEALLSSFADIYPAKRYPDKE